MAAVATLLLAACATSAPATPSPAPPTPAPTPAAVTPAPTSAAVTPAPAASLPDFTCGAALEQPGTAPLARISGFDVVNEDGVGRITITFRPEGDVAAIPDVAIRPGTPPFTEDPSGLPLDVRGTVFVVITLQGGTALDADYKPTFEGPFDAAPAGSPIVEVKRAGDFEAVSSWVVGLDGTPCVRILPSDGTGHLVIELTTT